MSALIETNNQPGYCCHCGIRSPDWLFCDQCWSWILMGRALQIAGWAIKNQPIPPACTHLPARMRSFL